ncbi:MAG: response regulator, partial [Candidatus Helarchaeota archaeon]|nr:response regulator [Candidatus Helarchaeota archaeon]
LILSDIIMPKMDGYDFFRAVSSNPQFSHIPFIFVSARAEPDDIRFGKMLGADDYITKPFKDADLLAVIAGKLNRYEKIKFINSKMNEIFSHVYKDIQNSKQLELFMVVSWDHKFGPRLECYYPKEKEFPFSLSQISIQLYESVSTIYGQNKAKEHAHGILLHAENINKDAYVFFDHLPESRGTDEVKQYMLAVIADRITYFNSLKIRDTLVEISTAFKKKNKIECQLTQTWKTLQETLAVPS